MTEYKKFIIDKLAETGLKPNSVKLYSIKLYKLYLLLDGVDNNNSHLSNYDNVLKYLESLSSVDDKLAYLNAILKISEDMVVDIKDKYLKLRAKFNDIKFKRYMNNTKPDNFINYSEYLSKSPAPDFNKEFVGRKDLYIQYILDSMMLFVSVRYPMRLTLSDITIKKTKTGIALDKNYLYATKLHMKFIMNDFKNVDTFGRREIDIEKVDIPVFRQYLTFLKDNLPTFKKLLINFHYKPLEYNSNSFSENLKRMLNIKLNANLSMNSIRTAYETDLLNSVEYQNSTNEKKILKHNKLLHSLYVANLVYNRV